MDQISDLKQWLDSQRVKSDQALSPHHSDEEDFVPKTMANGSSFVPSPKFKEERYLWHEDGKNEHPEMNILAGQISDYEKAKALWYKNAWESVQPVNTETDNSNTFKKANMRKTAVRRTCPNCHSPDYLHIENKTTLWESVTVDNQNDLDYQDSEYGDDYEFIRAFCNNYQARCNWSSNNPNWMEELGYDNRKNAKFANQSLGEKVAEKVEGRWDPLMELIIWPNGQKVYLDANDNGDTIELHNIRAEPEGTGAGTKVLKALQAEGKPIRANEIMAPEFFNRNGFVVDEDYDEELYGHAEPDQWWFPNEK